MTSAPRNRRSILAVPASSWKMLQKAATLPADVVFIDMEDAVSPLERTDETRQQVGAPSPSSTGRRRPARCASTTSRRTGAAATSR